MKLRILLIDDDPQSHVLKTALESVCKQQLSVEVAELFSEGLERLRCGGIDLVLVALSLPYKEVIGSLLKVLERASTIPVIVLTDCDDEELAREAMKMGVQEYLLNGTFDERLLIRLIQSAVHRHARALKGSRHILIVTSLGLEIRRELIMLDTATQYLGESLVGQEFAGGMKAGEFVREMKVAVERAQVLIRQLIDLEQKLTAQGVAVEKKRILTTDDEEGFTRLLKLVLRDKYEVLGESDAFRVLATAANFKPDLILMDIIRPDVDGVTLAKQLKSDPRFSKTPIVFLTASISKGETQVDGFPAIAKPVTREQIIEVIEANL